jgi:superfamily II DNA or RNA helicase
MPISWKGSLAQYVGRLHRRRGGKTDVRVVDYVDRIVPILVRMATRRRAGYKSLGNDILEQPPETVGTKFRPLQGNRSPSDSVHGRRGRPNGTRFDETQTPKPEFYDPSEQGSQALALIRPPIYRSGSRI